MNSGAAVRQKSVEAIVEECRRLDEELNSQADILMDKKGTFDHVWEDQINRIYGEQELFQYQVNSGDSRFHDQLYAPSASTNTITSS